MHESVLLRDLRRKLTEIGGRGARIRSVRLWVGALAPIPADIVRAHWAEVVRGSPAEGATLAVETSEELLDPRARSIVLVEVRVEEAEGGASIAARRPGSTPD